MSGGERYWIAEIPCRAVKTVLIRADSRRQADEKLHDPIAYEDDIEGVNVSYGSVGVGRVIREDKPEGE